MVFHAFQNRAIGGTRVPIGRPRTRPPKTHLSPREREILTLAAQGQRVKQIARTLWLSPHTVRNHLKNAYRALRVSDLAEALLRAVVRGDVPLPPAEVPSGTREDSDS